jgi:hypothetical protein
MLILILPNNLFFFLQSFINIRLYDNTYIRIKKSLDKQALFIKNIQEFKKTHYPSQETQDANLERLSPLKTDSVRI